MVSKLAFVSAIVLAVATRAFQIPEGQEDGVYLVSKDENGNDVHTKLPDVAPPVGNSAKFRHRRQDAYPGLKYVSGWDASGYTCFDSRTVDAGDWQAATDWLANSCDQPDGQYVPGGAHLYATVGTATAYMCNNGGSNNCVTSQFRADLALIGQECLNYAAGNYKHFVWGKSYGYDQSTFNFCDVNPNW